MAATSIALTRARGMASLPRLVEQAAGWRGVVRIFSAQELPLAVLENPDMPVPLEAMLALFDAAACDLGDPGFGVRVGQAMTFADYGMWGQYIGSAPTLAAATVRARQTIWMHQSGAQMGTVLRDGCAILYYRRSRGRQIGQHHADHVIWPMISLVREYLGPEWLPAWVEVDYPRSANARCLEDRVGLPARYSRPAVGVAIPVHLMSQPYRGSASLSTRVSRSELLAKYGRHDAGSFSQKVRSVISLRLFDGRNDIDGTARLLGLSARALQRLLEQQGVSYRQLVDECRCRRAVALLREGCEPISEIAIALGYEEPGNFTRAFRRWTGKSPKDFRALLPKDVG